MSIRESQKAGRLRLAHLREFTEAVEHEMADERVRFTRLAKNESAPRICSSMNLFQTPEPLAQRLAGMIGNPSRVLEPSAGLGRLYRAVRSLSACHVTLVEQSAECCGELYRAIESDSEARLVQGDFLAQTPEALGLFDAILANPPFKMGVDAKSHIPHMLRFLAPGGRLVSLCANGPRQRAALQHLGEWIELPEGSFKSEGTNVSAAIVVIQK